MANAIEKTLDKKPELKWPNDLTIKGKKVAGMLVDASLESNRIENLVSVLRRCSIFCNIFILKYYWKSTILVDHKI